MRCGGVFAVGWTRLLGLAFAMLALLGAACACTRPRAATERPNIVMIIGDDHGYPYAGFMGNPIVKTPHLDELARGGVLFTTAYAPSSVCAPTLRALVTGHEAFPRSPGASHRLPPPTETLPGLLAQAGYASLQAGKFWFPGYKQLGFTEGTKGDQIRGNKFDRLMGGLDGLEVGRTTMKPVYDFIDRHQSSPFLLFFAPMLPHRPWDPSEDLLGRYAPVAKQLTPSALAYYANISRLDDVVGELIGYLETKGLRSRTLIVYFSDNGFQMDPHENWDPENHEFGKDSMSEMGYRTPLVFNWPGQIPAGVVRDDLVSLNDLFPTLLDFAGVKTTRKLAGIDLRSMIEQGTPVPRTELIGTMRKVRPVNTGKRPEPKTPVAYFVRTPRWHYLWYPVLEREQLFDLEKDPRELHDVVAQFPEEKAKLRASLDRWIAEEP